MQEMNTIKETCKRAAAEGLPITEYALRLWLKRGDIPSVRAGSRILVYWPNVRRFLTCADAQQ